MITSYILEDYCSEELSSSLAENGYVGATNIYLDKDGWRVKQITFQSAMKWLRKEHNLAISTSFTIDGWRSYVSQIKLDSEGFVVGIIDDIDDGNIPNCDTYEEACEAAIKYCLENLI